MAWRTISALARAWLQRCPNPVSEIDDQVVVLGNKVEAERDRGGLRIFKCGPLVLDERGAAGATGKDFISDSPIDSCLLGQHQRLGKSDVESVDEMVDGQLAGRTRSPSSHPNHPFGDGRKERLNLVDVPGIAACHDRELSRFDC